MRDEGAANNTECSRTSGRGVGLGLWADDAKWSRGGGYEGSVVGFFGTAPHQASDLLPVS